jgi:hypothetical protein
LEADAPTVTGVIAAHLALFRESRLVLLGGWIVAQVAVARLDAAQPAAGAGGDIVYLVPAVALLPAVVAIMAARPMPRRAG